MPRQMRTARHLGIRIIQNLATVAEDMEKLSELTDLLTEYQQVQMFCKINKTILQLQKFRSDPSGCGGCQ